MAKRRGDRQKLLGPLEAQIMGVVWTKGSPLAVREVVDRINSRRKEKLAYTTVMTVMGRLARKGILTRRRAGRGYLYEAAAPDAAGLAVQGVMREFGDAALAHLLEEAKADPAVLKRLQRLLDER